MTKPRFLLLMALGYPLVLVAVAIVRESMAALLVAVAS